MKSKFTYYFKILGSVLSVAFCYPQVSNGQMTVTDNQTATQLAQILAGPGVTVLNASLNSSCLSTAVGKFNYNGNPSDIGIDSGIILTNGSAVESGAAYGANSGYDDFSSTCFSTNIGDGGTSSGAGDPDLDSLIGSTNGTHDACVLDFDFVPIGDTVKFDYVFASEEYNGPNGNFNCSISDVFGFFISGPGYSNLTDVALIPGTDIIVGVPTVNDGVGAYEGSSCYTLTDGNGPYTQYYNNNEGNPYLVYSGFTDVFTAIAPVIPCDTFHLKLAIADASDCVYDSGVFLKAGSLSSIGVTISDSSGGGQIDDQSHAVRGCKPAKFVFHRVQPSEQPLTIHYTISGTAVIGADYTQIPDSVVIPANQMSADVMINPLLTPPTGPRSVILTVYSPYLCGNGDPNIIARDTVMIYDSLYATPPVTTTGICPGDSVQLVENLADGLSIHWMPTGVASTPNATSTWVHPTATTTFTATITQNGAPATCPPVKRYYNVHVDPIPKIVIPSDEVTFCLTDSVDLPLDVLPENYEYTYKWVPATGLRADDIGYNRFYAPLGDYNFTITAYSPLGCASSKDLTVHVIPPFEFTNLSPDTTINYGDQIQLHADGAQLYEWAPPRWMLYPNEADPYVSPLETTTYTVIGINKFGCRDTDDVKVTVLYVPKDMLPSAFSPNGDGLNDVFEIKNLGEERILQFAVFNRYGQQVFSTTDPDKGWDGTFNDKACPADVYNYIIKLSSPNGFVRTIKGDVTLVR